MDKPLSEPVFTVWGIIAKFARDNPGSAFFYMLTLVFVPIQSVLLPHLYGRVVNAIQQRASLLRPFLHVIVVIALLQLGMLLSEWNEICYSFPALNGQLRKDIMTHTFRVHETNYDEQHTALLIARLIKVPNMLYNLVEQYKVVLIPQAIVSAVVVAYFLANDVPLGLGIAACIAIIILVVNIAPSLCIPYSANREHSINRIFDEMDDMLRNMMAIYNLNTLDVEEGVLDDLHQIYLENSWATLKCIMLNKVVLIPIIIGGYTFFMWRCYHLGKQRKLSTGTFVSLFMIMLSLLGGLNSYVNQLKELVVRKGVLSAFMETTKTPLQQHQQQPLSSLAYSDNKPAIEVRNVSYIYPKTTTVTLKDVSLVVPNGQKVLIRGRIGCGKSTLMRLLMKYKLPSYGELYLHGVPYSQLTAVQVREVLSYIPQNPILFNRTLYENIVYGIDAHISRDYVSSLLKSLDVEFPEGLDSQVGKGGSRLSGGQRQIVWILRVMIRQQQKQQLTLPPILLMDEPTASIDPQTKQTVHRLIQHVMQNHTVIMVAHDEQNTKDFDRVITMEGGEIVYEPKS